MKKTNTLKALAVLPLLLSAYTTVNAEVNEDYRQTYFTHEDGDTSVGASYKGEILTLDSPYVSVIDNEMMFKDETYGHLPIYAVSLDEILESRTGKYTFGLYGSVIEITYPDGTKEDGIILDACGACRYDKKIDKWLYKNDKTHDITGISYTYKRVGWDGEEILVKEEKPVETPKKSLLERWQKILNFNEFVLHELIRH